MISFTLISPVDSPRVKLTDGKLIVAEGSDFEIQLATEETNSPNSFIGGFADGGGIPISAEVTGDSFAGNFIALFKARTILFTAHNAEVGTLDLTVVPKFYAKKMGAHIYKILNYTEDVVLVEIENADGDIVANFALGAEESKEITLSEDGYYKITYTQGAEVKVSAIVDTSMIDKFYTDGFRALFCNTCGGNKKEKFLAWVEVSALRDAFMMTLDQVYLPGTYYNTEGFEAIVADFVTASEILKKLKLVVKDLIDAKCLTGCSCGC
jgi:hypothetical protein